MKVSAYENIFKKNNPVIVDCDTVLKFIKSDRWKVQVYNVRQSTGDVKARHKQYLPSICFSGIFNERTDKGLIQHSGLVVLDFDKIKDLPKLRKEVESDEFTYSCFVSPSGDGLKVLVKIPPEPESHEAYYLGLIKKYPNLDTTSKNISRVCYISHDKDLYLNKEAKTWTTKGEIKTTLETNIRIEAQTTNYNRLQIIVDMVRNSTDGNKHHELIKASRLAGGFIAGGMIEEHIAVQVLQQEINNKNISDFKGACKTITDGIEYGKKEPLYDKNYKDVVERIKKQEIIIKEEPVKDVVYLDDVREQILYDFEHGSSRGETTHFESIDNHFRWKRGDVTLNYGIGNHGKSAIMYQLAMVKSVFTGAKWAVFSPENLPEREFYKDLIHTYVGKSPESFHFNRMSREELELAMDFVKKHFYLIVPKDEIPTPEYMHNRFREFIIKLNVDGCITDPYNQLDNDLMKKGGREDQYISSYLTQAKRFAIEQDVYYIIISHPKGTLKKTATGDYEIPNVYDLAGGAMWNNKVDNILFTHRPYYTSDPENTTVLFGSQKIKKQKLNGLPGMVALKFDRFKNRFYMDNGLNPMEVPFCEPEKQKETQDLKQTTIDITNDDFYSNKDEAPF